MLHKFPSRSASLFRRWIVHRTRLRPRAILLARFKWIVVKLWDSGAKQPRPAAHPSPLLPFLSLLETARSALSHLGRWCRRQERNTGGRYPPDSIREHLRVNASPLGYIRGHVRRRQKEKSPWETKWRKTQYARVRERKDKTVDGGWNWKRDGENESDSLPVSLSVSLSFSYSQGNEWRME